MKSFLSLWKESMDSWNFYVVGWWILTPIIGIIHSLFFWLLFGNLLMVIIIDSIVIVGIPILLTFIDALKDYRWNKRNPNYI